MIELSNYHTHSKFSDGRYQLKDMASHAFKSGFKTLGFSDHAPVPFKSLWNMKGSDLEKYKSEIYQLKQIFNKQLDIYFAFEVDYITGIQSCKDFNYLDPDYIIGGVHYLNQFDDGEWYTIDYREDVTKRAINEIYGGDIKRMVKYYYQLINEMIDNDKPDIVAHIDLIKKFNINNQFFDPNEKWYRNLVLETLQNIKTTNTIMELNISGQLKTWNNEYYPSSIILKEAAKLDIKSTINFDAHRLSDLNLNYNQAVTELKNAGFKFIYSFEKEEWKPNPI